MTDTELNAVERLIAQNKNKKSEVPPRNASLNKEDNNADISTTSMSALHSKVKTAELPDITDYPEPIRKTIRLDPDILRYMDLMCLEHKITKDSLVEAYVELLRDNQKTMDKVIKLAKQKREQRKAAGENKRFKKSLEKHNY